MAMLLIGSITVGTLFVLRRRRPQAERPYRATGYPWVPAVYVLANVLVMAVMVAQAAQEGSAEAWFPMFGVGLLVLTFVGHRLWRRYTASG
jgi:APA family basic amino acid/polyamine antiporter